MSILNFSSDQCIPCRGEGVFISYENLCECHVGFILHPNGEECTRCAGPGARLDNTGECGCDGTGKIHTISKFLNKNLIYSVLSHIRDQFSTQSSNSQCSCGPMTFENEAGTACIPCAKGVLLDDICTCAGDREMLNSRGIACVSCWGSGAYLDENDACKCGLNAIFDETQERIIDDEC